MWRNPLDRSGQVADGQSTLGSLPRLEEVCGDCNGTGRCSPEATRAYLCPNCDGTGFVLTAFGAEVFSFVEHAAQRYRFRIGGRLSD